MFANSSVYFEEQNRGELRGNQRVEGDTAIALSLVLLWSVVTELMEIMTKMRDPQSWKKAMRDKRVECCL